MAWARKRPSLFLMQNICLFIGVPEDPHLLLVRNRLRLKSVPALIIDPLCPDQLGYDPCEPNRISLRGVEYNISALWWRWKDSLISRAAVQRAEALPSKAVLDEWFSALKAIWAANAPRSVNAYLPSQQFSDKMAQLRLARSVGIKTPSTLLSNSKALTKQMRIRSPLVIKPFSHGFYVDREGHTQPYDTSIIEFNHIDSLSDDDHRMEISFLQEYIERRSEIRINYIFGDIIGRQFKPEAKMNFDPEVHADWRPLYAYTGVRGDRGEPFEIDDSLRTAIENYALHSQLNILCFDIAENLHGEFVFFEANPDGQWLWLCEQERHIDGVVDGLLSIINQQAGQLDA
jgi:hypothetical protein